ncbi:MAG: xylulokinase [Rhizobiaceae bacterium]
MSDATRLFAGVDAGTTGVTVALFTEDGRITASADRDYPCIFERPGWVEQDMDIVWRALCEASREAMRGVSRDAVVSVGLSSQRGTFVLLDENFRPLAPAIVWSDARATEMEAFLASRIAPERFRAVSGMPISASWAVAKIAWVGRHKPQLLQKTRWICNGQEYLLRLLGAAALEGDPSSLTLNGMLDIRKLHWSDEICRAAGIDMEKLPPIGQPGTRIGGVSATAAELTGLPAGAALCRGAGDQQCAAVGAGVVRQGMAEITIGTSAMMVAHLDHPDLVSGEQTYLGAHAVPGKWDLEGGSFAIGACLQWWRDRLERPAENGENAYAAMMAEAAKAPPGSQGIVFHPFFAGQVTPHYDASARGAFLGLTLRHERADLIRAMLEGCACEMRMMVDAFDQDLASGIDQLRLTGGGTRSPFFAQIVCDVLGRPVGLLRERECSVLGAALLGAVAAGYFTDIGEAVAGMVSVSRELEPQPQNRAVYDDLLGVFRDAYKALSASGFYHRLQGK